MDEANIKQRVFSFEPKGSYVVCFSLPSRKILFTTIKLTLVMFKGGESILQPLVQKNHRLYFVQAQLVFPRTLARLGLSHHIADPNTSMINPNII